MLFRSRPYLGVCAAGELTSHTLSQPHLSSTTISPIPLVRVVNDPESSWSCFGECQLSSYYLIRVSYGAHMQAWRRRLHLLLKPCTQFPAFKPSTWARSVRHTHVYPPARSGSGAVVVGACSGGAISAYKAQIHLSVDVVEALKDRKSTRLNSSHSGESRMPSSA